MDSCPGGGFPSNLCVQGYALVGIAGMLAANCKIPLTALLLLLELKGDYSCVASAAAAVSLSYWLASYCETIPAAVPTADKADSSGTDEPGLIATPDVWRVSRMEELMELDRMTVRLEMQRPTTIPATASIVETITAMKGHPCLFVIDASGALKGMSSSPPVIAPDFTSVTRPRSVDRNRPR